MKKIIKIFVLVFLLIGIFGVANADTSIHLKISLNSGPIYDQDLTVSPCDSDNLGTLKTTAYCAILRSGVSSVWDWSWPPGAFLTSLAGISGFTSKDSNGNDVYHYWSWSANGTDGMIGLNQYELAPNDSILITFIDPEDPTETPTGGGALLTEEKEITPGEKIVFDSMKAFEYLSSKQKEDGSFGEDLYTDWTALALANIDGYETQKEKLIKYYQVARLKNPSLTDYERRTMAFMALGINPYEVNGENYIEKIVSGFDNRQFGNIAEINDDIFALIALQNAGYDNNDPLITQTVKLLLSRQEENGSWDGNIDMTGAGMGALAKFSDDINVKKALEGAKTYLKQNQKRDGGFGNVSSTAWATEGILALGEKPEEWKTGENSPIDFIAQNQDTDGGIKGGILENRVWQTAYALTPLSGKTWNQIMQNFPKPILEIKEPVEQREEIAIITPKIETQTNKFVEKPKAQKKPETLTASAISANPSTQLVPAKKQTWWQKIFEKFFGL